uniref:SH3 domain-containing protein n=1 Tax=Cyprinus carpio carpio TaxID=630221 RepID=A0A9J8A1Q8_CYPCA
MLLEAQATVDIKDSNGMRPLHYAALQGKADSVLMLLRAGASVNGASQDGQIPLHLAAKYGHYEVSEMLLQHQSNPCTVNKAKKTPLDLACEFGRHKVTQLLLSTNMVEALLEGNGRDNTPLHLAAHNGHKDIIRLLLKAGIDINRTTKSGTALHEAALYEKTEVVQLLLDAGIDVNIRNTYNQSALDIVNQFTTSHASKEIKQLLRDASGALQVRALKDYWNLHDPTALNIRAGDIIMVLEQHMDGRWKGHVHDSQRGTDRVGFFPPSIVEVVSRRSAGDRNSVGSAGSMGSSRSAGSGQSTEGNFPHNGPNQLPFAVQDTTKVGFSLTHPMLREKKQLSDPQIWPKGPAHRKEFCSAGTVIRAHIAITLVLPNCHQKKLMLAVKKLSDIQKARKNQAEGQALLQCRRAPPALELVAIEHHNSSECPSSPLSPKMLTFQDSELSVELKNAMARSGLGGGQDGFGNMDGTSMRLSQESIGTRSGGSGRSQEHPMASVTPNSCTQESLGSMDNSPSKESQDRSQISPVKMVPVLPLQHHHPSSGSPVRTSPIATSKIACFEYPPILTKPRLVVSPSQPHHGSPHQRGFNYLQHQNCNANVESPSPIRAPQPNGEPSLSKKCTQSLSRYAMSDGENEEDDISAPTTTTANVASYATLTRKPGRSQPSYSSSERQVGRSHSFAIRAKRKGPPPPPPKRLSSAPSGVEMESAGSVRSFAARLKNNTGSPNKACNSPVFKAMSPAISPKNMENRRRTASESSTYETKHGGENPAGVNISPLRSKQSSTSSQESIPFAEEGKVTIKQRTKIAYAKIESEAAVEILKPVQSIKSSLEVPEINLKESDTVKRRHKPKELQMKGQGSSTQIGNERAAETEMVSQCMQNSGLTKNPCKSGQSVLAGKPQAVTEGQNVLVHKRLEQTSTSLEAALKVVEKKLAQEDPADR